MQNLDQIKYNDYESIESYLAWFKEYIKMSLSSKGIKEKLIRRRSRETSLIEKIEAELNHKKNQGKILSQVELDKMERDELREGISIYGLQPYLEIYGREYLVKIGCIQSI